MANFGVGENCRLLLRLSVMQSKTWKVARGQVGTRSVGLVGSKSQLIPLSFDNLLVNFLPLWYFYLHFKLTNAYLQ